MNKLFEKLDALEARVRAVEIKIAFGAGIIVAVQVLVGIML